jgi:glycosyltransferase involved in cell wall biosynthesis
VTAHADVSSAPLRIALTADPELPVPPRLYGGIERVIDMLARGLIDRGHEVTLFAHPDSQSGGALTPWPGRRSGSPADVVMNAAVLAKGLAAARFDIVHSFSRIAYLMPILPLRIPKLMTYQRAISARSVRLGHALSRGTLQFSAISRWMSKDVEGIGRWHMVPNGVDMKTYDFQPATTSDAPLVFLGRLEEIKGPHLAIEIARGTGSRLILAGNIPEEHRTWFDAVVRPQIDDAQISYIGPVDDAQKNKLLGGARAFLMPILWEEPFGIVMAEALACGAPVLGLRRGAVPEIVEEGVTGFVSDDVDGLVEAVARIGQIDRKQCRRVAEQRYSEEAVVGGYLSVYRQMLQQRQTGAEA